MNLLKLHCITAFVNDRRTGSKTLASVLIESMDLVSFHIVEMFIEALMLLARATSKHIEFEQYA